ncbi:STAS-like domain-containing protein [Candidatus Woesearchaeota archaeon]|nr:STAS-like domain-containing protein [Candidatus Woesearchaeota archaeon]MBW3006397.1 STAS-like domain-containing protein [Candidatus Woesearchaeota archaeon]
MIEIKLLPVVGSFAENKDLARDIRIKKIIPALEKGQKVTLDFKGIDSATQSFIHALISDLIRNYGAEVLDKVYFKDCSETVRKIIQIVVDYMQEMD